MQDIKDINLDLKNLRKLIFLTAMKAAGSGLSHLASSFSCLEILYALYVNKAVNFDLNLRERDRLILSKGHGALALYAVMSRAGLMSREELLKSYLKDIGGEPSIRDLKGIEASTGSLGHGLSVGVGMALAQKLDKLNSRTFVIIGDGECQEGSIWEAAISAAAFDLDNLAVILDCNNLQKMCAVKDMIKLDNWSEKFKSFGFNIAEVDGHDVDALNKILNLKNHDKPLLIIAHTVKGKGISIMENNANWHFKLPNKKELKIFKAELDISDEELS